MKTLKFIFFMAVALIASACSKQVEIEATGTADVHVNVDGFSISQEDMPQRRATKPVADYAGVKAITLAFFKTDGTKQYETTQLKADATTYTTFSDFSLSLPYGSYTMVVLGYASERPIILNSPTSAAFDEEKSRETFAYTQAVNITNSDAVNLSATLSRIITRLVVESTDDRAASVKNTRITFAKGGKAFNPTTGLATSDAGFVNTIQLTDDMSGTINFNTNFFIATDEETMDITVETLDSEGNVLFTKNFTNVPFKRNRATILKGAMFSASTTASFTVESTFLENLTIDF